MGVESELEGNLYTYVIRQLRYIKYHHAATLGTKEVQLHDDRQEPATNKETENEYECELV